MKLKNCYPWGVHVLSPAFTTNEAFHNSSFGKHMHLSGIKKHRIILGYHTLLSDLPNVSS